MNCNTTTMILNLILTILMVLSVVTTIYCFNSTFNLMTMLKLNSLQVINMSELSFAFRLSKSLALHFTLCDINQSQNLTLDASIRTGVPASSGSGSTGPAPPSWS